MRGYGLGPGGQVRGWNEAERGGTREIFFELDSVRELGQFLLSRVALHHHQIGFFDMMFWVSETFNESAIIREQEQTFAIAVEPPGSVDVWNVDKVFEGGVPCAFVCKLGKHAIGFVEEKGAHLGPIFCKNNIK